MELTELQEDLALKNFNKCHSTVEFWQQVTERKYPELKNTSALLLSVFSTTYCCESLFFVMKFVKSNLCYILMLILFSNVLFTL